MNKTSLSIILLISAVAPAALVASSGCVNVKAPERITIGGDEVYSSPPSGVISPADPNSATDLRRENEQLRQRIAWLESRNRNLDKNLDDLRKDADEIRAEMRKIADERDRYRRDAGK